MNRPALALALAGLLLLAGCTSPIGTAAADTPDATATPDATETTVVATGTGSVTADADLAVVRLAIVADADTADGARSDAADRSTALVDALRDAGVSVDAITTVGYSLSAQYNRDEAEPTGYRAVHVHRVEVTPDQAGSVVDAGVAAADAEVHGVSFTLTPETRADLRASAVENAVENARVDADAAAGAANLSVTGVEHVEVGSTPVFDGRTLESADAGTEFRPGPVTVEASVTVTYRAE